ncbi:hypothetical protein RUM44_004565 [Polyplax serrata]|uniref:SWIM-type domain-containing protein n=1 Tax=Polyplax serrata TaxID=468196 RepID=A0ABR1B3M6_POLSC
MNKEYEVGDGPRVPIGDTSPASMEERLRVALGEHSRVPPLDAWDEDRFTFEDSDRFEEDSLCSWSTEPESLCNNWRGWKRPGTQGNVYGTTSKRTTEVKDHRLPSLSELTAKCVASHIPFELVEYVYPPVPEQLQLRIAFWSFPDNEEDIRLYSCLANGSADEFQRGENLFRTKAVQDPLQIGFHLSASVVPQNFVTNSRKQYNVAVTFDRRRITSCNCTCSSVAYWCAHVVAVCLYRINNPDKVCLRAPVSESLSRLKREQLQKFAQYLISELPQQILPTAQRLLDELLSSQPSAINSVCGAPDPTAGASVSDQTSWYLDQKTLHDNIKKILIKFCVPAPIVFSDVNCLSSTAPPAATEWTSLLRPLRGREPEGMWNLLSIVMEMFKRNDRNAVPLLEIITEECMACEQILVWWYTTSCSGGGKHLGGNSNAHASQYACSSLCDEIVVLWRLAALNPGISPEERLLLEKKFTGWHAKIIEKVVKSRGNVLSGNNSTNVFPGFKPAIQACRLDWEDYPIPGITYTVGTNQLYHCPFTCFKHNEGNINQVNSSPAVLNCHPHPHFHPHLYGKHKKTVEFHPRRHNRDHKSASMRNGYRSSVSSEGFCENEADADLPSHSQAIVNEQDDADSQEGGGSDSASSSDTGTTCQNKTGNNDRRSVSADSNKKARNFTMKEQSQSSEDSDMGVFISNAGTSGNCGRRPKRTDELAETNETSKQQNELQSNNYVQNSNASTCNVNNDLNSDNVGNKQREPCESEGDSPRRASNDSATSNSDSQQSGDEYNVYYYTKTANQPEVNPPLPTGQEPEETEKEKPNEDPWDVLFARSEGLHAHGHVLEACALAVRLAHELLANPPNLMIELPQIQTKGKRRKVNPASHQISCLASATLAKCAFLCSVLAEVPDHHNHLAFRVGMFGLEMARPPASTKPLEVKLANQEADIVNLMKRIPLGPQELKIVKEKAEQLRDGTLRSRGEALLPIMLASFIFDALEGNPSLRQNKLEPKNPADETLAFEAAVAALGLKANVSEADHPLLCEGTRRQRGDLILTLLMHYKDEPMKLTRIMEKLLDREVHNLIKTPLCGWYYSTSTQPKIHPKRHGISTSGEDNSENLAAAFLSGFESVSQELPHPLGNRPHSGTSAELEQGVASISISTIPAAGLPRGKDSNRFKGKRMYPSIPNQPSEAGAHFMFELAKTVLNKAGGNSSTSLFTQASTSQQHHGPHRALHFCAFQIGLYALGLHNCVSPNWLSRTYSSHVCWITGQAVDIGALAISFLIDTWEGHLTPPEAASIADRASRARDINTVRAAAELALSCLPHAHALNPNEIQRAIVQCKEQSEVMLERSCLTVENAAKGGGVYPEVLFQVAKYWYDLYMRHTPGGDQSVDVEAFYDPMSLHFSLDPNASVVALVEPEMQQNPPLPPQHPSTVNSNMTMMSQPPPQGSMVMTTAPPPLLPVPYAVAPYSFTVHPLHSLPPPSHLSLYLSPPQYQYPNTPPGPLPQQYFVQGNSQPPLRPIAYPITTMQQVVPNQVVQPQNVTVTSTINVGLQQSGPVAVPVSVNQPLPPIVPDRSLPQSQVHRQGQNQYTTAQFRCLFAAYRVGMLALETLARRVHDDRPQAKYARHPPYGDDVKWLLQISKKLGTQYLHKFCMYVVNSIVSPFILHEVAIEAAHYLARNNPSLILQYLRSSLTLLVTKCQQMYIQCIHHKLYHLTNADYDDFVNAVCAARAAFLITPEGSQQFKEWLQSIKRSKSCKKELWAQINAALQANNK